MIKQALLKILREFKNVQILLYGEITLCDFLKSYSSQIILHKFIDWKELPEIISNIDINISPLEENIFN